MNIMQYAGTSAPSVAIVHISLVGMTLPKLCMAILNYMLAILFSINLKILFSIRDVCLLSPTLALQRSFTICNAHKANFLKRRGIYT